MDDADRTDSDIMIHLAKDQGEKFQLKYKNRITLRVEEHSVNTAKVRFRINSD